MTQFTSILVANRGEIACRVMRTARDQGYRTIAVYSEADAGAPHTQLADDAVCIGPGPVNESYLVVENILEAARAFPPAHVLLASTSSVYGANTQMPYKETDQTNRQMSFYAATKKATEAMAHSYAHLYDLPITMFRFFTVYGPWGRPDMAHFKFTRAILNGEPIDIYNHGKMQRDFTYIDDLVASICALIDAAPLRPAQDELIIAGDSLSAVAPYRVVNIGNGKPVELMAFIAAIEAAIGQSAEKQYLPMQPGDVPATWADAALLHTLTGERPATPIDIGIQAFVDWYRDYYGV